MRKLAIVVLLVGCGDGGEREPAAGSRSQALITNAYPSADASVRDGTYAKYPRGALSSLEVKTEEVGWNRRSYLRFDLAQMPEPIRSAKLYLYGSFSGSGAPVRVQACAVGDTTWTEPTLTWNNAPAMDDEALATVLVSGEPRWYSWDLTSYARTLQASSASELDLALRSDQYGSGLASFASREASSNWPVLSLSTEGDNTPPTVAVPAYAWPRAVVTDSYTWLTAQGHDDMGEVNLTYTWETLGTPPAPVRFSPVNDQRQTTYATFSAVGTYAIRVTITDGQGLSVTSDVNVEVQLNPRRWRVEIQPSSVTLRVGETFQFEATAYDQFSLPLVPQPPITWTVDPTGPGQAEDGSITGSGLYTAGTTLGEISLRASSPGIVRWGTTRVTVVP